MVDLTTQVNQLNIKLQGTGKIAFSLLEEVIYFERKVFLLSNDIEKGLYCIFKVYHNIKTKLKLKLIRNSSKQEF